MDISVPSVSDLGTVAGLGLFTTIVVEIILRAISPTAAWKDRFGPFLALLVAAVLSFIGAFSQGGDIVTALLLAIIVAGTSMGIHDTVDSATT